MLPLVAGLFWSVNSQLAACENKGESIVATYFSLELLYSSSDNGGVRDRRQGETKGAQRDQRDPGIIRTQNWESPTQHWAPTRQQYMRGSDLYLEVVLHQPTLR